VHDLWPDLRLQCRFAVLETDDPLAGYTDKLDERFVDKQQSG
jgi:hypothetical protein